MVFSATNRSRALFLVFFLFSMALRFLLQCFCVEYCLFPCSVFEYALFSIVITSLREERTCLYVSRTFVFFFFLNFGAIGWLRLVSVVHTGLSIYGFRKIIGKSNENDYYFLKTNSV